MMVASRTNSQGPWLSAILVITAIWLGMLMGVSFLATPVKFMAPSLTLPVALDVGRHTFAVFNKAEWLLCALLLAAVLAGDRTWPRTAAAAVAALLVVAETFWLLPLLDQRVETIIAGQQPTPSSLHALYIGLEVAKLLVLIVVILAIARRLAGVPASAGAT